VKRTVPDRKEQARRAALNALRKARRAAERAGVELSDWEDEFIASVSDRVKTYGRAFGDPEKGDPSAPLSVLQAVKLKEISAKTKRAAAKKRKAEAPEDPEDS
jgi:Zn-dependent oligopeptidase